MKASTEDLLAQSQEWAGWQAHLCDKCKEVLKQRMQPIQRLYNQGGFKKKYAEARMASMAATLWTKLCNRCIKKIRRQARV